MGGERRDQNQRPPRSNETESDSESDFRDSDEDRCSTPESQKDTKCSVCRLHVTSSDKSLQCDNCSEWCHIKCGGVTKDHYKQMVQLDESNIEIQWHCPPCDLANPTNGKSAVQRNNIEKQKELASPVKVTKDKDLSISTSHIPRPGPTPPLVQPTSYHPAARTPTSSAPRPITSPAPRPQPRAMPPTTGKMAVTQNGGSKSAAGRLSFPDCRIRDLPFFPSKSTLLRPCNLTPKDSSMEIQQQNLAFYLTQEQANMVNNGRKVETNGMVVYKMHILLRFTKMSPDGVHDDDFPKNVCLKVNNKICPLPNPKPVPANRPNMEAKRPPKPLIVTSLCKLNTKSCLNQISITWTPSDSLHTVSIYLVEKLSPGDLLVFLKARGQRDPEITKALIRSKLEDKDSDEIATTSCKVTMACPLGMARMTYPARSATCDHLQCFDVDTYLRMNEKKPKWVCPVCNKPAYFENLFLDGFYIQLLQSPKFRALSTNDIVLNQDATWEPVISEGVGVSDDSEDEGDPLAIKYPLSGPGVSLDADVIPITPIVDADGAPIMSQLADLPIAPFSATSAVNGEIVVDNVLPVTEEVILPEDDYVDWNFSVKFFQFIRTPPVAPSAPSPVPVETVVQETPAEIRPDSPPPVTVEPKPVKPAVKPRGGAKPTRGRSRGGGSRVKRFYDSDELEYSSDERKKPKSKRGGGRGSRGGRGGAAKPAKRGRYVESSEEEESETEEEVLQRSVPVSTSARPSRNCRRSTNYADIERSGDVLDYFLN